MAEGTDSRRVVNGALPTAVASRGKVLQATYRFAVHDEPPAETADDMGFPQQAVVGYIESLAV